MEKVKIQPGFRVGMLQVTEPTSERKCGYTVWRCRCDCGGERLLDTRALQRGSVRDCGCLTKSPPGAINLTGQRFGRLVAVSPTDKREYSSVVWRCLCDCGNVTYLSAKQLLSGTTKSCGCLGRPPRKRLEGKRFGQLTVLSYAGKQAGMHRWRCQCDCGKETIVGQTLLQSGKTKSCGCRKSTAIRENLKLVDHTSVTKLEATATRLLRSNTSGHNGVYKDKKTGKWRSQITFKGKTYYLGSFSNLDDAVQARRQGEQMYDDFLCWYYSTKAPEIK